MKKQSGTFITIDMELFKLGNEEAKLVTVISSWGNSNKQHFLTMEEYCDKYHTNFSKYKRSLKKLKDHGIVKVVKRLPNNRQVLMIDNDELRFVLANGYQLNMNQSPAHNELTISSNRTSDQFIMSQPPVHSEPTHILDKVLDKVTKQINKEVTKPEDSFFDDFRNEIKQDDIDPRILSLVMDFDKDF